MSAAAARPPRPVVGLVIAGAVTLFALGDLLAVGGIDPFTTPSPSALGSGVAPDGGHCASPP